MKLFLSIRVRKRRKVPCCAPAVEELESRRLLAATAIGPVALSPTPGPSQPASPAKPALTAVISPTAFINPLAGTSLSPQVGFFHALAPGVIPLVTGIPITPASVNGLTAEQALAQRVAITALPPAPPPVSAYGEGMILYNAPVESPTERTPPETNRTSAPTEPAAITDLDSWAENVVAKWRDAVDAYFSGGAGDQNAAIAIYP
jgi:hypothetical protein